MRIDFKNLEDYLYQYGYPYNELMKEDYFLIPEQTSYEYLMKNIKEYDGIDAMTFYGSKIKYSEFADKINETADALKGIGVKNGDRIATLIPNIPEGAYMQYGPSKIGAVPSNIDPRTSSKMLLNYINKEKIKEIVIVDVMYETAIRPIERELKEKYGIDKIIVVPATNSLPFLLKKISDFKSKFSKKPMIKSDILEIIYWNDLINNSKFEHAITTRYKPDKEAVIQHSSGTTMGIPKSIPLTNENINMFVEKHRPTIFSEFPYGTRMLHILPYFASYGAINSAHLGFNFGLTLQEIPEFKFEDFGLIAAKNKSEILIGVPNWFNLASKDKRIKKNSLKYLKMAISGGDSNNKINKEIEDNFLLSHGAKCIETNGHGMSELGGSGCYTFPGHEKGLGVGIPFPYDKYVILDENGDIVPLDEKGIKGCAWIYSPSATLGVFDGESFVESKMINGFRFINSKDTMFIEPNYEMSFVEREDRVFTRYDGYKIVPSNIESKFISNKLIKQCMVVPYEDDDLNGKMPIAYVVPIRKMSENEQNQVVNDIVKALLESENNNCRDIPRKIFFMQQLPQNAMSKNDFRTLINRKLDGTEFTIDVIESNLKTEDIVITPPKKEKAKILKKN